MAMGGTSWADKQSLANLKLSTRELLLRRAYVDADYCNDVTEKWLAAGAKVYAVDVVAGGVVKLCRRSEGFSSL